ncbi:hypothetical protein [Trinickia sp.]|uniref:hypothetical protein n=1 Tax=Trinickia sp. TaxID=2571163 RepID=UPI003F80EB79
MSIFSDIGNAIHHVVHGVEHMVEGAVHGAESLATAPFKAATDFVKDTVHGHPFQGFKDAAHDFTHGVKGGFNGALHAVGGATEAAGGAATLAATAEMGPEELVASTARSYM